MTASLRLHIHYCSFEGYQELWRHIDSNVGETISHLNCPVTISTNTLKPSFKYLEPLSTGVDVSWSDNLLQCLEKIDSTYVLLMHDDLFLKRPIDSTELEQVIEWMDLAMANYVRLSPTPPATGRVVDRRFREINTTEKYRTSVVNAIFRKAVLMDLLCSGEDAWSFEKAGTTRSMTLPGFYQSCSSVIEVENLVIKGLVRRRALKKLEKQGILKNLRTFPIMTLSQELIYEIHKRIYIIYSRGQIAIRRFARLFVEKQ